jgi:tripartite-type tricarboxylate transporter receptor subunit TctC
MKKLSILNCFVISFCFFQCACAQNYPEKPISIVVPFAAGSGTDSIARVIAQRLSDKLKQAVSNLLCMKIHLLLSLELLGYLVAMEIIL